MKGTKKRALSLVMALCLTLSLAVGLTACGGKPTLEDYFNSDAMQTLVNTSVEQYETQGVQCEVYASGDELHYDFTLDQAVGDTELQAVKEILETSLDESAQSFTDAAKEIKAAVSNETVMVVVTYLDNQGTELATQSFSSAD